MKEEQSKQDATIMQDQQQETTWQELYSDLKTVRLALQNSRQECRDLKDQNKTLRALIRMIKLEMPRIVPDNALPEELNHLRRLTLRFDKAAKRILEDPHDPRNKKSLAIARYNLANFVGEGKRPLKPGRRNTARSG